MTFEIHRGMKVRFKGSDRENLMEKWVPGSIWEIEGIADESCAVYLLGGGVWPNYDLFREFEPVTEGTLKEIGAQVGDIVSRACHPAIRIILDEALLRNLAADDYRIIGIDPAKPDSERTIMPMQVRPGYDSLFCVLAKALHQAQEGKGNERHAAGQPFTEQPIFKIGEMFGMGFQNGQALKKMIEAQGMIKRGDFNAAEREILGAINYLAAVAIEINHRATAQQKDQSK